MPRARTFRLLLLVGLVALVCGCRGPVRPYRTITAHVSPLREQFNADAGNTRILLLPAPT